MARHQAGPSMSEDNFNPALRPSVDHLISQLRKSPTLNRDLETQLYVIESLADWFFFREATLAIQSGDETQWNKAISVIHRLAVKLQHVWMMSVAVRSKDWPRPQNVLPTAWDEPMPVATGPTRAEVKEVITNHQIDVLMEDDSILCTCGKQCLVEAFNKHQRVQVLKALFPETES